MSLWRLRVNSGWPLAVSCWRLVAGGWRLVTEHWSLNTGGWWLVAGGWWLVVLLVGCDAATPRVPTDVLYMDEFVPGESGRWLIEGDEVARSAIFQEQLVIAVDAPKTMQFVTLDGQVYGDFALEVDTLLLAGSPNSSYGVLFRMMSVAEFYRFDVTGTGLFVVERHHTDGTWTRLTNGWLEAEMLQQGANARNRLGVTAVGSDFTFFVNGQVVANITDASLPQGNIALDTGTFELAGTQVAFDNLVIRAP